MCASDVGKVMSNRAKASRRPAKSVSVGGPVGESEASANDVAPVEEPILTSHPPSAPELTFLEWFEYFPYVPAALAVKECVRLKRIKELPVVGPVLDVGCGDGLFTSLAYPHVDVWGIDINEQEAARAQASKVYEHVLCQSVTDTQALPAGFFSTCVANCSLEHVPNIAAALRTIHRSMRPGGVFYLFVPKSNWTDTLPLKRLLGRVGLGDIGRAYGAALDAQFAHHHLYEADRWTALLHDAGFSRVEHEAIGSDGSQAAFEAALLPSVLAYVTRKLTGRWIVFPSPRRLYAWPVFQAIRRLCDASPSGVGAEILLACRA